MISNEEKIEGYNKEKNLEKISKLAFDKKDFQNFIYNTFNDGKKIYVNKKTEKWLLRNRLQLPNRFSNNSVSEDNIP